MPETSERRTVAILVVGMAGSGKTSFIRDLIRRHTQRKYEPIL